MKRSLASEEHAAASSGPALASWQAKLTASINRAGCDRRPRAAGIQCMLYVTQEPGGVVTQVKIGECNGDQAVRESIEAAVYRASPLPPPPDPALFDRKLKINFNPTKPMQDKRSLPRPCTSWRHCWAWHLRRKRHWRSR